jgi:hypothetical protein
LKLITVIKCPKFFGRLIVFAAFLIIFIFIITSPRLLYCYSTSLFHYYYYYYYYYYSSSTHFCPLYFSEMPWSNFMKPCRNIICHVKLCCIGLIFSKWLPLPWKRPRCKNIEKHKNDHSRLLAEQKLMKLDRNNIHS